MAHARLTCAHACVCVTLLQSFKSPPGELTALHIAAERGSAEMVRLLVAAGAKVSSAACAAQRAGGDTGPAWLGSKSGFS